MNRLSGVCSALVVLALITAIPAEATSSHHDTEHYNQRGLQFEYPSSWRAAHFEDQSSFTALLVVLSNQKMRSPCIRTKVSVGVQISCGRWGVARLDARGVLVEWFVGSALPGNGVSLGPGLPMTIDGLPARAQIARPGDCRSIGGQETITVFIPTNQTSWYSMSACIRGPNLASTVRSVRALLLSTKFATGS